MYNLLVNWDELLAYFTAAELAPQQFTSKTKARLIKDYLRNRDKYLYFQFSTLVVQEFERVNATFQQTNADPSATFDEQRLHYKSLQNRVYLSCGKKKSVESANSGVIFLRVQKLYFIRKTTKLP